MIQRRTPPRVVYLSDLPEAGTAAPPSPYRVGEAGRAWVGEDGRFVTDTRIQLSANSTHALLGHGVVAALNELPIEGTLGEGLEVLLPPSVLDAAQALFYESDRKTYGATYEFVAGRSDAANPAGTNAADKALSVEYRIRIVNREYQVTLTRLAYLVSMAGREGCAVWIRI